MLVQGLLTGPNAIQCPETSQKPLLEIWILKYPRASSLLPPVAKIRKFDKVVGRESARDAECILFELEIEVKVA